MSYKIHGPWAVSNTSLVAGLHGTDCYLTLEVTDLIDHHGQVWAEGAWRVKVDGKVKKTFKGETAWNDSRRLFEDEWLKAKQTRWPNG